MTDSARCARIPWRWLSVTCALYTRICTAHRVLAQLTPACECGQQAFLVTTCSLCTQSALLQRCVAARTLQQSFAATASRHICAQEREWLRFAVVTAAMRLRKRETECKWLHCLPKSAIAPPTCLAQGRHRNCGREHLCTPARTSAFALQRTSTGHRGRSRGPSAHRLPQNAISRLLRWRRRRGRGRGRRSRR